MSFAVTVVLVKSDTVVELITVPLEIATPEVLMEFEMVGRAVPAAIFQNFTVIVPASIISV
jgi:hypothetical protein